ncbi:trypsin-like serine protease [Kitasatospora sp. NPDC056184]|uniref:trypsin-like serine protease n=1 Tax=Kitasatospora sp. NPDC056184 TaxID=3345738 RepID=UPI0035E205D8
MSRTRIRTLKAGALAATLAAGALTAFSASTAGAVAGDPAADGSYAYTARIAIGDNVRACTGALVDRYWVITAASCFAADPAQPTAIGETPSWNTTVTVGRTDLTASGTGAVRTVEKLVASAGRDLVMAKLAAPVDGITPLRVAESAPTAAETLRVPAYGRTKTEWVPTRLHSGAFTLGAVRPAGVDLAGTGGAAVCKGDTGAPVIRGTGAGAELVAVASRSWQGGCLGVTETRTGATGTRTDDVFGWINTTRHTTSSGTRFTGTPFTIKDPVDNHLVTYLQDSANHLWSFDPQGERWVDHGVYAATPPTAAVDPVTNRVVVYVNGPDNRLWSFDERDGKKWTEFPATPSGTVLAPDAVPRTIVDPATNRLVVFIRDTARRLWSFDPQSRTWTDVFPEIAAPMVATDPVPIINPNDQHITLYYNGPDNRLNALSLPDRTRTEFVLTPAGTAMAPDAVPSTVVDPASGHFVTYIRDTAHNLWSVDPFGPGWVHLGWNPGQAMAATDPVAAVNPGTNHVNVFVNGPENELYSFDPQGGGQHNGWTKYVHTTADTVLAPDAVPFAVVDPTDGNLTTFVRDTRSTLWSVDPAAEGWVPYEGGPSTP